MRIIGGVHRSRRLTPPRDDRTTRPITDRVKQALFDRLWSLGVFPDVDAEPAGAALDLFAGVGSLGLEALSRGIAQCTFIERDRTALRLLQENIASLQLADRSRVVAGDVLSPAWHPRLAGAALRLIFLDPPYPLYGDVRLRPRWEKLVEQLPPMLEPGGVLVLRTDKRAEPVRVPGAPEPQSRTYGGMAVHLYVREGGAVNGEA